MEEGNGWYFSVAPQTAAEPTPPISGILPRSSGCRLSSTITDALRVSGQVDVSSVVINEMVCRCKRFRPDSASSHRSDTRPAMPKTSW